MTDSDNPVPGEDDPTPRDSVEPDPLTVGTCYTARKCPDDGKILGRNVTFRACQGMDGKSWMSGGQCYPT
jgi:hypothetical protein